MKYAASLTLLALSACADKAPPTWPADAELTIDVSGREATVRWPAATDDTAVDGYEVRRNDDVVATLSSGTREFVVDGLRDGAMVAIAVTAADTAGNRSEPLIGQARGDDQSPPSWPASAVVVHRDGQLQWNAARDGTAVARYIVRQGAEPLGETAEQTLAFEGDPTGVSVVAEDEAGNQSAPLAYEAQNTEAGEQGDEEPTGEELAGEEAPEGEEGPAPNVVTVDGVPANAGELLQRRIGPENMRRLREALSERHGRLGSDAVQEAAQQAARMSAYGTRLEIE